MKKIILLALIAVLLAGCQAPAPTKSLAATPHTAQAIPPRNNPGQLPPPAANGETTTYLIDPNVNVGQPLGTYAITTDGQSVWVLTWLGGETPQRFTGTISSLELGAYQLQNALPSDSVYRLDDFNLAFESVPDAGLRQVLSFEAASPVTFDLYIDGVPALEAQLIFPYSGEAVSPAVMPFHLIPTNYSLP